MATAAERLNERAEKLGDLLAWVDIVVRSSEHHVVFDLLEKIEHLRLARTAYDEADKAYIDARLEEAAR